MKTWDSVYKLPLHLGEDSSEVWSANDHFVFQFLNTDWKNYEESRKQQQLLLDIINGDSDQKVTNELYYKEGIILERATRANLLLLRGWGGLTGKGGLALSYDEAIEIQETFAQFIIEQLSNKLT